MPISVLVVDDDPDDYELVSQYLADSPEEFTVDWVPDAVRARPHMMSQQHDVYLLDHRLGEELGVDLLGWMRSHGFTRPVILCSGEADLNVRAHAAMYGVSDILSKRSLSRPALINSIRYALGKGDRMSYEPEHV